jgi:hypothetical protein
VADAPSIMTMKKASPWANAPTAADFKAAEPPGDSPAGLRVECRADDAGGLRGCGFVGVEGGDATRQAARTLLPKYRLSEVDTRTLHDQGGFVVFYIVWRNSNKCFPPTCIGVVPPAPPPAPKP